MMGRCDKCGCEWGDQTTHICPIPLQTPTAPLNQPNGSTHFPYPLDKACRRCDNNFGYHLLVVGLGWVCPRQFFTFDPKE